MQNGKGIKDPQAVLDYVFDWSAWLAGDTISSQEIRADDGIAINSSSITGSGSTVTVWISGGTAGRNYSVTSHIVTVGGRTDERSMKILVAER